MYAAGVSSVEKTWVIGAVGLLVAIAGCANSTADDEAAAGRVTVGEETFVFDPVDCVADVGAFRASGVGSSSDGATAFIEVHASTVDDVDGDGTADDSAGVVVRVGVGSAEAEIPADQPDLEAVMMRAGPMVVSDFEYQRDGDTLTGSGTITDYNEVISEGRSAPLSFEVTCNP